MLLLSAAGILVCSPLLIGFTVEIIVSDFWRAARSLNFPNAQYWRDR